jgi:hypothetical protein
MILQQGVNLSKLDKGVLFLITKEEGYKILTVDSNRYDARYWLEHFLSVDAFEDENFITRKYLKFCQNFAKDVVFLPKTKRGGNVHEPLCKLFQKMISLKKLIS